ncbi:hypothetical protein N0V82_001922 [Gnomoniopsis sp. IMI 355080]|nr:hypothetical protein N0V82_001922 [Gnomoniopsis sp. IMI 355080]
MSKRDDNGTSQSWEKKRQPQLSNLVWEQPPLPVRLSEDTAEDVSPRSRGQTPFDDKQKEEMRRKLDESRARASPSPEMHTSTSTSGPPGPSVAAANTLNSVSPELLTELRKIIREEVETLKGDPKDKMQEATDKPPRPSVTRERPSSPIRPFVNAAGVVISSYPVKDTETSAQASPNKVEQKESPKTSTVRFSDETKPAEPNTSRVDEPRKASVEMTAIDMRWGVLFAKDGSHTKRMEHVVRGLANYIIEEFMPQRSIVITPEKMAAFYSHHRLDKEIFPFITLFRARSKNFNGALESLYEDLGCQYFLVQADDRSRHSVPALTPQGFMQWLVTMIQAYPDEEAKRLDKVVSALPIEADSLLDGKPERLPKQISRYLLPPESIRKTKRLVDDAMNDFREDIEGSVSQSSKASGRPTPIVVTATSDRRPSANAAASASSRYVPETSTKDTEQGSNGHDRDRRTSSATKDIRDDDKHRRNSMPAPSFPTKTGRTGSAPDNTRTSQSSRDTYGSTSGVPGRAPSSASSRKNRSPQRNPYSSSLPSGLDRDDLGGERVRGSGNISAAAANIAANVLGASGAASTQNLAKEPPKVMKDTRSTDYFGPFRSKRASLDESTPRAPASAYGLRDKVELESSSTSKSSKRRSMVLPELKRPTWDDYLKHSAPRSATPSFAKKGSAN